MSKPQIAIWIAYCGTGLMAIGLAAAVLNWPWPATIFTILGVFALGFALGALNAMK